MTIRIRPATRADLPRLTEIYNHYVIHTPVTFDIEPYTVERRAAWFDSLLWSADTGWWWRKKLAWCWAMPAPRVSAPKAAYDTTVETTVYSSHESVGKGIGRKLYAGLFEALPVKIFIASLAGTRCRTRIGQAHEMFGFKNVGVFSGVGYKFGKYWDVQWTERPLRLP